MGERQAKEDLLCVECTVQQRVAAQKNAGRWYALDASCLSGAVAAESDHGNTTVLAPPPATASSADPEEESKKGSSWSNHVSQQQDMFQDPLFYANVGQVCCITCSLLYVLWLCNTARSLLQQWGAARPFSGPSFHRNSILFFGSRIYLGNSLRS